jgi:hypothetical protein
VLAKSIKQWIPSGIPGRRRTSNAAGLEERDAPTPR